jgi:death-on-curing protein
MTTADDLIALNRRVLEYGGGQHGVEHETGLRYAAERPWLAFDDIQMYPTPFDKGAVLMENVIRTNPFMEGNKRTAFAAGAALIHVLTGKKVLASANEVVRVSKAVEDKSLDLAALSEWFETHTRAP